MTRMNKRQEAEEAYQIEISDTDDFDIKEPEKMEYDITEVDEKSSLTYEGLDIVDMEKISTNNTVDPIPNSRGVIYGKM